MTSILFGESYNIIYDKDQRMNLDLNLTKDEFLNTRELYFASLVYNITK